MIKRTSKFSKLFKAYCENRGIENESTRFILDGSRLRDDDTPESVEMHEGAVINASSEAETRARRSEQEPNVKITIRNRTKMAVDKPNQPEVSFKFPRTKSLGQIFEIWNNSQLLGPLDTCFHLNGRRVRIDDTAESLGLEDCGIIDAVDEMSHFVLSEIETDLDSIPSHIIIKVVDSVGALYYKIKRTKMLGKLIDMHIDHRSVDPDTTSFLSKGLQVLREDTVATLGLTEDAVIHAVFAEKASPPITGLKTLNSAIERKVLRIKVQNEHLDEFHFNVKSTALMKKVIDAYCKLQCQDRDALRFVFDGIRIQDHDTPNSLEMEDGDIVDVWTELRGGVGTPEYEAPKKEGEVTHINIRVKDQDSNEVHFKIKSTTPLRKVMDAYCQRQGLRRDALRFLFDGDRVQDDDTPESRELEDDDCLEVFAQQLGGSNDGNNVANSGQAQGEERAASDSINIRVTDMQGENELHFKVKKMIALAKVMNAWAVKQGTTRDTFRFMFRGFRVLDNDTPQSLNMNNDDLLTAHHEQGQPATPNQEQQHDANSLHLNVKVTDQSGNEQFFRIKKNMPLEKLMQNWCDKLGNNLNSQRFMFEGSRIQKGNTATSLEIEDGDMIQVFQEQEGGGRESEGDGVKTEAEPQIMSIKVRNTSQDEMTFKIKNTAKLGKLMKAYAVQQGRSPDTLRFFLSDGKRVGPTDTLLLLLMEDEDVSLMVSETSFFFSGHRDTCTSTFCQDNHLLAESQNADTNTN